MQLRDYCTTIFVRMLRSVILKVKFEINAYFLSFCLICCLIHFRRLIWMVLNYMLFWRRQSIFRSFSPRDCKRVTRLSVDYKYLNVLWVGVRLDSKCHSAISPKHSDVWFICSRFVPSRDVHFCYSCKKKFCFSKTVQRIELWTNTQHWRIKR